MAYTVSAALVSVRAGAVESSRTLASSNEGDVVTQAFALMLGLIRQSEQNAVRAARGLSYLAMVLWEAHGAWVGWSRSQDVGLAAGDQEQEALLAHVAGQVLIHFFPRADHAMVVAWVAGWAPLSTGVNPTMSAAQVVQTAPDLVLQRSMSDGAQARWSPTMRPKDFPGIWQPTFPMFAVSPLEGMAPQWRPWVAPSGQRYAPPTAARLGSLQHRSETAEVLEVARRLTAFQKERAQWWNLDAGSVTPAGVWLRMALQMLADEAQPRPVVERLRVLRDVCVAMNDAMIACWAVKLRDWSERPITAIRRDLDPAFVPLVVTPGHPSYVSGHATLSAAAAVALAAHWPAQREALWVKAEEAAMSRLWGGIHYRRDNDEGLRLGRAVGEDVVLALARGR